MLAVERDVKPRNMKFAKVERRGGGGVINREGAFIQINTICSFPKVKLYNGPINTPVTFFLHFPHIFPCNLEIAFSNCMKYNSCVWSLLV